jgi:hypothetical protein
MKLPAGFLLLVSALPAQEFVHGDECLFCHRNNIGPSWQKNAHGLAMRQKEDAPDLIARMEADPKLAPFAAETTHTLGSRHVVRYLRQSGYGRQDLLSQTDPPQWQKDKFNDHCARCHTTAFDPKTRTYAAIGIDCYACHGVVDLEHSTDTAKVFLSKKRRSDAQAITGTCAQCHLRDNTHVALNVSEVLQHGGQTTCISCHRVHANTTERHRHVLAGPICLECHNAEGPRKNLKTRATGHSATCEY